MGPQLRSDKPRTQRIFTGEAIGGPLKRDFGLSGPVSISPTLASQREQIIAKAVIGRVESRRLLMGAACGCPDLRWWCSLQSLISGDGLWRSPQSSCVAETRMRALEWDRRVVHTVGRGPSSPHRQAFYMTGGTVMPMTAKQRISSRRTTATVASRNFFRVPSDSLRIGCRW